MNRRYSPKRKPATGWHSLLSAAFASRAYVAACLLLTCVVAGVWYVSSGSGSMPAGSVRGQPAPRPPKLETDELLGRMPRPANLNHVMPKVVLDLAAASGAPFHRRLLLEQGVDEHDVPFAGCRDVYFLVQITSMLSECLPFARRGALAVFADWETSEAIATRELARAAALGRAGFLVLLTVPSGWPLAQGLAAWTYTRVAPNVLVTRMQAPMSWFIAGLLGPDDPIGAPVLLLGKHHTEHSPAPDLRTARQAGAHVLLLVPADSPERESYARDLLCSGGVTAALVAEVRSEDLVTSVPRDCATPFVHLVRELGDVAGEDAFAAQVAAVLLVLRTREAPPETPFAPKVSKPAQHPQAEDGGSPAEGSGAAATTTKDAADSITANGAVQLALPRGVVPEPPRDCAAQHGTVLTSFLIRCVPGTRGVLTQAATLAFSHTLQQRPQYIARAAAALNTLVVYMEEGRPRGRLQRAWKASDSAASSAPHGDTTAPPEGKRTTSNVKGVLGEAAGGGGTRAREARAGEVFLIDEASAQSWQRRYPGVYMVQSPMTAMTPEKLEEVREAGTPVVYEYIDAVDEGISGGGLDRLRTLRDWSKVHADLLVYSAGALRADLGRSREARRYVSVPNGVDPQRFSLSSDQLALPPPRRLERVAGRGKPIVGYFGAVAPWIWVELVTEVATAMPDVEVVMIGPAYPAGTVPDRSTLPENLHYLGAVEAAQLPLYARFFDAAFIPFRKGDVAKATSPLKLFEYFALGLPVVVTDDMLECVAFEQVLAASDAASFAEQLRVALSRSKDDAFKGQLRKLAQQNSWEERAAVLLRALGDNLELRT